MHAKLCIMRYYFEFGIVLQYIILYVGVCGMLLCRPGDSGRAGDDGMQGAKLAQK